jgi:CRP/FNR family cyclic AMP-dependent transcriptional regulator
MTDIEALFDDTGAFGGLVLEGILLQSLRVGNHAGLRMLGPGDVLALTQAPRSILVVEATCRATVPTRMALLEREMLMAVRRWPQIAAGLHAHAGEQSERLVTQLMICQLPRVDERIVALMWLLAESWGQVTPDGTLLPISLTHAALGGLIGARRPTVTLALGKLTSAGVIRRRPQGWLLLRSPEDLADAGAARRLTAASAARRLTAASRPATGP